MRRPGHSGGSWLARARAYVAGGIASVPLPADSRDAVAPSHEFEALLEAFAGDPLLTPPTQAYLPIVAITHQGSGRTFSTARSAD